MKSFLEQTGPQLTGMAAQAREIAEREGYTSIQPTEPNEFKCVLDDRYEILLTFPPTDNDYEQTIRGFQSADHILSGDGEPGNLLRLQIHTLNPVFVGGKSPMWSYNVGTVDHNPKTGFKNAPNAIHYHNRWRKGGSQLMFFKEKIWATEEEKMILTQQVVRTFGSF